MPLEGPTILEATTGLSFLQNAPVQPSNTSSLKLISMQHLLHVPSEAPSIRMHSAQKLILHACTRWLVQKDSSNEVLAVPARVLSLGSECSFLIFLPCKNWEKEPTRFCFVVSATLLIPQSPAATTGSWRGLPALWYRGEVRMNKQQWPQLHPETRLQLR